VTERAAAERIVRELHRARVNGDLAGMCSLFADDGRFEIAGASADKPIAIRAQGLAEFKPWLAMMTKVFRLSDYHLISLVIEGQRVAAHWRVSIFSMARCPWATRATPSPRGIISRPCRPPAACRT